MLGVCYYPEHWSESMWEKDAQEMQSLGLTYVRIGEFAWSRIEPTQEQYDFSWLDRAIDTLSKYGLKVIMCTPTATPPKWLLDLYPDILPVDINTGTTRGFGSRRHYDFSSPEYLREALKISEILAKRYGEHPAIVGWQTDNEIACHDTTHSGSVNTKAAFQSWCQTRYKNIDALNSAWGTVFWSMEYTDFSQIELPILAVTETNPSHQLAFRRFSSDQVISFHDQMIQVIRKYATDRFVTHNFIPMVDTQTDNFALAKNLDFVSYDNYPLGRSDMFFANAPAEKFKPYMRTGHPDFSSYSFDHSRGISNKNFWIMEQQPGPVNWAHHNPRPEKGMVRLWSWQAFAHGADCVCYFRWRQASFAQEQMHAGVKRNDNSKAQAWYEIEQMRDELKQTGIEFGDSVDTKVAMVMSTENQWVTEIERQGDSYIHQQVEFAYYSSLRQLGMDVDFISVDSDLSQYELVIAPCLPIIPEHFIQACKNSNARVIFGPRSGGKTNEFHLAPNLPPGVIQQLLPAKILSTETLRPDCAESLSYQGKNYESTMWREELAPAPETQVIAKYHDDSPAIVAADNTYYIATLTCDEFLKAFFKSMATELNIAHIELPKDVRLARRGQYHYFFNYSGHNIGLPVTSGDYVLGSSNIGPYGVSIVKAN
jgi:beta-galactosidase